MTTIVTPLVHWHQTNTNITLKLDIHNATDTSLTTINNKQFIFTCTSTLRTEYKYTLELLLYDTIDINAVTQSIKPLYVLITLNKSNSVEWPRLIDSTIRNNRIKVDWDQQSMNDEHDIKDNAISDAQYAELNYKSQMQQQSKPEPPPHMNTTSKHNNQFISIYLLIYNITVLSCWLSVLLSQQTLVILNGIDNVVPIKFWQQSGTLSILCQLLSSVEILHILLKSIPGNLYSSIILHTGRNIILTIIYYFSDVHNSWSTFLLYTFWSIGDITRYIYYAVSCLPNINGVEVQLFIPAINRSKSLRVTVPLYVFPLGVLAELVVLYNAAQTSTLNHTDIHLLMISYVLIAYGTGCPTLYKSMLNAYRKDKRSSSTVHP